MVKNIFMFLFSFSTFLLFFRISNVNHHLLRTGNVFLPFNPFRFDKPFFMERKLHVRVER